MSLVQFHSQSELQPAPCGELAQPGEQARQAPARSKCVVRLYRTEDEPQVLDLLALCLPRWARSPDRAAQSRATQWRWKHFDNPFGASHVLVAVSDEGTVVGAVALMPWRLRYRDQVLACARTVDMVTHPAYRGQGVASSFWPASRQHLVQANVALTFHTPNRRSILFARKGGRPVWTLQPRVNVLKPFRALSRALRHRAGKARPAADPAAVFRTTPATVSELLERRAAVAELLVHDARQSDGQLRTDRSVEYLAWRYASNPALRYYAVCAESQGRIDGVAIFRVDTWTGISRVVLQDVLLRRCDHEVIAALRRQLMAHVDPDLIHHYQSQSRLLLGRPGLPATRFNFTVGVYQHEFDAVATRPSNWDLTLGDLQEI